MTTARGLIALGIVLLLMFGTATVRAQSVIGPPIAVTGRDYSQWSSPIRLAFAIGVLTGMTIGLSLGSQETERISHCLVNQRITHGEMEHLFDDFMASHQEYANDSMTLVAMAALSRRCPSSQPSSPGQPKQPKP